jgi:predicted oxidoreductase (fatty acid repression mutant protein)
MRTSINGTWGDQISTTDPAAESVIKKEIRYTVPSAWNARNCRVVVYVHDYNASKNILQAVALPLVP